MELKKQTRKIRCEMGCKNYADYSILPTRIRNEVPICKTCMTELYALIGGEIVPKSVETIKSESKSAKFGFKRKG